MIINIIAARSLNNVIATDNRVPWLIPENQSQFEKLTAHNVVIMGRKTYESIGHPLKNRTSIVVSKTMSSNGKRYDDAATLFTAGSLEEALKIAEEMENVEVFIVGGGMLYEQTLHLADRIYVTDVDMTVRESGTTIYFPEFTKEEFALYDEIPSDELVDDSVAHYTCRTWIRKESLHKFGPVITGWRDTGKPDDERKHFSGYVTINGEIMGNICLSMYPDYRDMWKTIYWAVKAHDGFPGLKGQTDLFLPYLTFEETKEIAGILFIDQLKQRREKQISYVKAIDNIGTTYGIRPA